MDRITHQSPRQRGYGSTSSLRNDSLKHTWKHEKIREESNQEVKLPAYGGPSSQTARTVRDGHADRPAGYRGLSAPLPLTVRPEPRTFRKRHQNHQRRTANNGPSAGSTRTVRQAPADRPPSTRGPSETSSNQNTKTPRIESEAEQEHEEHATNTRGADRPPGRRGPSARHGQSRKQPDLESQLHQIIIRFPKRLKLWRQGFGDLKSVTQGCYSPKILPPNSLNHRESRIL
jgi:hypothetical protein